MQLRDRAALITGATGGLGAVTACMLAEDGVDVAVTHLGHRDEALAVCKQIEAMGRKAIPIDRATLPTQVIDAGTVCH